MNPSLRIYPVLSNSQKQAALNEVMFMAAAGRLRPVSDETTETTEDEEE